MASELVLITKEEGVALKSVRTRIAGAMERLARLKDSERRLLRRVSVKCHECGATHAIGALTYIQTHWYVRPSGCTDGDYYNNGEGKWDCPACGLVNRLYDKPEIMALCAHFAGVLECYCTQDRSCCSDPRPCDACKAVGRTRDGRLK